MIQNECLASSSLPTINEGLPSLKKQPATEEKEEEKEKTRFRVCSLHHYDRISKIKLRNYDFNVDVNINQAWLGDDIKPMATGKASQKPSKNSYKEQEKEKVSASHTKPLKDGVPSYYSRLFPVVLII